MNTKSQKTNWILDLLILASFLLSFFLDLTGTSLHQWLGVSLGVLLLIHLFRHWDWVDSILVNFFKKASAKARLYAIIDFLLLFGTVLIVETGLIISTWFNFNLQNYDLWWSLHVYASISTLIVAVIKIGLHWRWIVNTTAKIFKRQTLQAQPVLAPAASQAVSRRQFMAAMGVISLASTLAILRVLPTNKEVLAASSETTTGSADLALAQSTATTQVQTAETSAATATQVEATGTAIPQATATAVPTAQPTATTAVATQTSLVCGRSCRKGRHCSYPGDCHDYSDRNSNGLCDLGECA